MKFIRCHKPYLNPKVNFFELKKDKSTYKEKDILINPNANAYYDKLDFEFNFFLS